MPPGTRVVRRTPFWERVRSWLNFADVLLWLSEELNSQDWIEFDKRWSNTLGVGLNLLFVFLRINSTSTSNGDDIFDDEASPSGLISSFVSLEAERNIGQRLIYFVVFSPERSLNILLYTKCHFHSCTNKTISIVQLRRKYITKCPISKESQGRLVTCSCIPISNST